VYTEHFGLERAVFDGGIAQNADLFLGKRQQLIAANLKIGLTTRDSVVTLTGGLGVGKTTLAAQALRISATRLAQTWIGSTSLTPDEMLETLLAGFELAPYDMGRVQRIQTWRQFMGEMSATDTRICILVENALALGLDGLQALEALTAADPNDCPGANLILMGPADLLTLLEEPTLAPLKLRIRSRQRLDPMTLQEVEQYLEHRVAYAGGDYGGVIAPGTAAMVHCFSAGIPRIVNNVCETGLTVAAAYKLGQLNPKVVECVAKGVYGLAPNGKLPEVTAATTQKPVAAAPAAEQQPVEKAVPPAKPAVIEKEGPTPEAAPVDLSPPDDAEQSPVNLRSLLGAPEMLIDRGDATADQANAQSRVTPDFAKAGHSTIGHAQEPPVLTDALVDDVAREQRERASEPPVLTDRVDFDVPIEIKNVLAEARRPVATLPLDAPKLPESEMQPDEDFSGDFAAATHLHEISDEMAEMLFSADPKASATGIFEAAVPIEDDESDDDDQPAATSTSVF
jgi:general secretion pathway protein A